MIGLVFILLGKIGIKSGALRGDGKMRFNYRDGTENGRSIKYLWKRFGKARD
tara:strand:- start:2227 stop:2382 length:156 start_codon:yes stop_codon:yes gene_type:complete